MSATVPTLPDTHYLDAYHMNAYGAWVFTQQTGQQLANWLKSHSISASQQGDPNSSK